MFVLNSPDFSFNSNYITVQSAARYSGYNPQYIRRLLRNGKLQGVKIGQVWLIKLASLEEYFINSRSSNDRRCGSKQTKNSVLS